jgi:hypothetical protein
LEEAPIHGAKHVAVLSVRKNKTFRQQRVVNSLEWLDPAATQRVADRWSNIAGENGEAEPVRCGLGLNRLQEYADEGTTECQQNSQVKGSRGAGYVPVQRRTL